MRQWQCQVCGFIYDEAEGLPDEGIAAGTKWEDIPDDWECPDCGVGKSDFEMYCKMNHTVTCVYKNQI